MDNPTRRYFPKLDNMLANNKKEFLKQIPNCKQFDKNDVKKIYEALLLAQEKHGSTLRKNGDLYVNHPIAVASIITSIGLDAQSTIAALLHDVPEDTGYPISEIEKRFGSEVATIVDGVTKIGADVNEETHEKILSGSKKDIRVVAVKTADRFHNMYTLYALPKNKQIEIATESRNFNIPILKALGIYEVKDELQDLCLYYLDNESFFEYLKIKNELEKKYNNVLNQFGEEMQNILCRHGYAMRYKCRVKNVGGMYEDVQRGTKLENINDLLAIKMIVEDPHVCYQTLGLVHKIGKPIFNKVEDYIASPKKDGYRSLNTNIVYKDSELQVRIRTKEMQKINDLGVFANWGEDTQEKVNEHMIKELGKLSKRK